MPYTYIPNARRGKLPCETDSRRNRQKGTAIPAIHGTKGKNEGAGKPVRPYLLNSFRTRHGEWAEKLSPGYGKEIHRALARYCRRNNVRKYYRIPKTICPELFETAREIIMDNEYQEPEGLGITTLDEHYVLHMRISEDFFECSHCILSLKGLDDMNPGEFRNAVMQYTAILLMANDFTKFYNTEWYNVIETVLQDKTTDGKPNEGVDEQLAECFDNWLEESIQIEDEMPKLQRLLNEEISSYNKIEKKSLKALIEHAVPRNAQEEELRKIMLEGIDYLYEKSWTDCLDINACYTSVLIEPSDFCYITYSNENGAAIAWDYNEAYYNGDDTVVQPRIETWLTPEGILARSTDRDDMVSFVNTFNEQLKKFEKNGKHN